MDYTVELSAIKEALSTLQEHETVNEFAQLWNEIGLEEHHREDRRATMVQHIAELLESMLNEEKLLKDRMLESVRTCMAEMDQLERELKLITPVRHLVLCKSIDIIPYNNIYGKSNGKPMIRVYSYNSTTPSHQRLYSKKRDCLEVEWTP